MYNKLNKRVGDDMTLGEIIKEYRISHSLSMDGFSKLSGISKAYISLLENMHGFIDTVKEIISRYSNKYLQDDLEYYVGMSIVELRSVLSRLWKDKGFYIGESAQFCVFYC